MSRPPPRSWVSARAVLCSGGSPQPLGSGYRGSVVFPSAGGDHSSACLGLPVAGLVSDAPPCGASPILFPRPESPGGLLGCVLLSLGQPGRVRFSTLPLVGWVMARVGEAPISPGLWSPPSGRGRSGLQTFPFPYSSVSWFTYVVARFCRFHQFWVSVSPSLCLCPAGLGSHGVITLILQGLDARSVRSFLIFG